jgi:hypothetical protein
MDQSAKMEDERPSKKRKVQNSRAQTRDDGRKDVIAMKQKIMASEPPKQLGFMISRKRRQRKTRS